MKILIYLHHPAQYHMFKYLIKEFKNKKYEVIVFAVKKDILTDLLDADNVEYINNYPIRRSSNRFSMLKALLKQDLGLIRYCLKNRPSIMIGTSPEICHVGYLLRIPAFSFGEDDVSLAPLNFWLSFPFAKGIVSPDVRKVGRWKHKKISYSGYQKLAYLHPKRFTPNKTKINSYIDCSKPYFLIRLSKLDAHHDTNINGFNVEILREIIYLLKDNGNIYISSEDTLPEEFEKFKLKADITAIHHILYFTSIYIGDSQSMAVEAAVLGVPNLRLSDFSGRISVLEDLEKNYELTYGFKISDSDKLIDKLQKLIKDSNLKQSWQERRKKMLKDKIDVTSFWCWFIENYPESYRIMKESPEYQNQFKA